MKNKEYILCAAVKRITPNPAEPYWNDRTDPHRKYNRNDICDIEIGYRHHDIYLRFGEEVSRKPQDQGFYTSKGRFVDRKEGLEIARAAGQVDETIESVLISEDLY